MVIGTPRETHRHEHRVGLTPFGVARLVQTGNTVLVEKGAGLAARFSDQDYEGAGAQIVYGAEEVYQRADIVCRFGMLSRDEIDLLKPRSGVCGFHHLAVMPKADVERLMELETTLLGYEIIRNAVGELRVLIPMSEIAGQMAVHIAAELLQNESGGRGILLGSVPGVPPPTVLILGAGTVGQVAAHQAYAAGANVIVLDENLRKLRHLNRRYEGQVVTVVSADVRLEQYAAFTDVLIGAVLIPGARAPFMVSEDIVRSMKPGSVIIDASIDQGGCVETSRPTTPDQPTFVRHDVVHYCVPNMTANVARTASRALATAALPYLTALAEKGLEAAVQDDPGLAAGIYMYRGRIVRREVGDAMGLPVTEIEDLDQAGAR